METKIVCPDVVISGRLGLAFSNEVRIKVRCKNDNGRISV